VNPPVFLLSLWDKHVFVPLQTMTSVIMLTMMLVGGFYVTDLPSWISWMKVSANLASMRSRHRRL
jgi:hypothetical protein